jgi:hypothetical protein
MRARRLAVGVVASIALLGCSSVYWYPEYEDAPVTSESDRDRVGKDQPPDLGPWTTSNRGMHCRIEKRLQLESGGVRILLFPVNLVACVVGNFCGGIAILARHPDCLFSPANAVCGVLVLGPLDAWHGYAFWQPTAADPDTWYLGFSGIDS